MAMKTKKKEKLNIDELLQSENIIDTNFTDEMQSSFLTYALMTFTDRAIPDVKDGLKPVQRRILFDMQELGLHPSKGFKKSARIVGDTMGRFHPHGDASIYSAMCKLAQKFSTRYPLVNGQGNFGSIDGDAPAASRYTEAKLTRLALTMLEDVDNDTVDMKKNFSEEEYEPIVLPALFPQFLVNGASGIATAYTTEMPSHNLNEACDAIIAVIKNPNIEIKDLVKKHLKGPDFPGGSYLIEDANILKLYETGTASLRFRAKYIIEEDDDNNKQIVITELPPDINKPSLMQKLYKLCIEDKKIQKVTDVRDESSDEEVKIIVELHKSAIPTLIIKQLYKETELEKSKGFIMRAIVNQAPLVLNLKEIIEYYIEHRRNIILRRTESDLKKINARLHILDGHIKAKNNLKKVIEIITNGTDETEVITKLMETIGLTEIQAKSVIDIKLRAFIKMENEKILNEIEDKIKKKAEYGIIIDSVDKIDEIIIEDLCMLKKAFGDKRRTEIINPANDNEIIETISDEPMAILLTNKGNINHMTYANFDEILSSKKLKEKTNIYTQVIKCTMTNQFVLITKDGYYVKASFNDITGDLSFLEGKQVISIINSTQNIDNCIITLTNDGLIKKTPVISLKAKMLKLTPLLGLENNEIILSRVTNENDNNIISLATNNGIIHRFYLRSFSATSPGTKGLGCIILSDGDKVVDMDINDINDDANTLVTLFGRTQSGKSIKKTLALSEFLVKGRMSKGASALSFSKRDLGYIEKILLIKNDNFSIIDMNGNFLSYNKSDLEISKKSGKPEEFDKIVLDCHLF